MEEMRKKYHLKLLNEIECLSTALLLFVDERVCFLFCFVLFFVFLFFFLSHSGDLFATKCCHYLSFHGLIVKRSLDQPTDWLTDTSTNQQTDGHDPLTYFLRKMSTFTDPSKSGDRCHGADGSCRFRVRQTRRLDKVIEDERNADS